MPQVDRVFIQNSTVQQNNDEIHFCTHIPMLRYMLHKFQSMVISRDRACMCACVHSQLGVAASMLDYSVNHCAEVALEKKNPSPQNENIYKSLLKLFSSIKRLSDRG